MRLQVDQPIASPAVSCLRDKKQACMFLRPYLSVNSLLSCHNACRPEAFAALRSISAVGSLSCGPPTLERSAAATFCSRPAFAHNQTLGHWPMPWAGRIACNSNHALQNLNGLRKGLLTTQTLVRQLAPYAGGVTALSAGSHYLRRQQTGRSKRRSALNHGVALVETNAPASMQQTGSASSSSSESDADITGTSGNGSQSDDK
jgi:hypothetical protein